MAYDPTFPADDEYLSEFPAGQREQIRAIVEDTVVNALKLCGLSPGNASGNIPKSNGTRCVNLNADMLDGHDATYFSVDGHTHSAATTSSNGFMSNTDKTKLNGIATGAEVNQNAFANVKVGSTTIQADAKQDTLEMAAGSNIGITPDATNDKVTIAFNGTLPVANGGTGAATAAAARSNLGANNASNINAGTLAMARLPFKIAYGSGSVSGSSALTINYSSAGFTSVPCVVVSYSTTGSNWSGDNGALKIYSKTTTGATIIVGGSFNTSRNVDWIAIGV